VEILKTPRSVEIGCRTEREARFSTHKRATHPLPIALGVRVFCSSHMKVFLRNTRTGLFYAGPDQWTTEHTQAVEFEGPSFALDRVTQSRLETVEVIIHFEASAFNIPLKIVGLGS
jgi:hypothetical protein